MLVGDETSRQEQYNIFAQLSEPISVLLIICLKIQIHIFSGSGQFVREAVDAEAACVQKTPNKQIRAVIHCICNYNIIMGNEHTIFAALYNISTPHLKERRAAANSAKARVRSGTAQHGAQGVPWGVRGVFQF
ncbi:Hypothetical_protein [Hexamita inflata]|uniref:Hypothetical_protein n=1 Tax=Hexamita inflata TaxID=28002 RepID=A0AA86QJC7_9EUKA|nr:Hypothetical protein HINF_LOCUS37490 [Hexamita inflata]CAI9960496.1 Hypothetical protein HINF_LOCUS48141 [Hexamita inflata]